MATATVIYPQGAKFDLDYYKKTHMPLVQEKWGPFGLKSWKVVQLPDEAPYKIQATLEWGSIAEFQKAAASAKAKEVLDDVRNFCDKEPIILAGEVVFSS